ncbi:lipid storage droplets surface-binding protein 1 [Tribolium castaneum]|nr:PREDICTED: lipid storage droplets surface-binding protein 1 isoform X1 [Tribolium castaneum]|eukprot:XP_966587.1 PREDICTED: lipid storage droplets surface-binding protein 1 isoform X1 [Tribolium castaneum]
MTGHQLAKKKPFKLNNLESVNRITTLPIVESGWNFAEGIYHRIKKSNNLVYWTLQQAESSLQTCVETALPTIALFETPISSIDKILCKGLDVVEHQIPSIGLPPEMIYWNTKQYVSDVSSKIVKPVLKRADSVKQIGTTVLSSKYTEFAASTLDGALDVADKYVDKYLPAAVYDPQNINEPEIKKNDGPAGRALQTIHHVGRFSGKLQRRLTKRTLAEAKALKEQSAEAINVLIYVAELIATDPKLAFAKGKELWASLSKDEPENQARPENLEQLIVLLTRESARRVVHLINFTSAVISKVPKQITNSFLATLSIFLHFADSMVKSVHLEGVQQALVTTLKYQAHHFTLLLKQINIYFTDILDNVAQSLVEVPETQKSALEVPKIKLQLRAVNRINNSNGVDSNSN